MQSERENVVKRKKYRLFEIVEPLKTDVEKKISHSCVSATDLRALSCARALYTVTVGTMCS